MFWIHWSYNIMKSLLIVIKSSLKLLFRTVVFDRIYVRPPLRSEIPHSAILPVFFYHRISTFVMTSPTSYTISHWCAELDETYPGPTTATLNRLRCVPNLFRPSPDEHRNLVLYYRNRIDRNIAPSHGRLGFGLATRSFENTSRSINNYYYWSVLSSRGKMQSVFFFFLVINHRLKKK